jgi:hypothetical protein
LAGIELAKYRWLGTTPEERSAAARHAANCRWQQVRAQWQQVLIQSVIHDAQRLTAFFKSLSYDLRHTFVDPDAVAQKSPIEGRS